MNQRNSRTTHPKKTARRQRAAERFSIDARFEGEAGYMKSKAAEAASLGLVPPFRVKPLAPRTTGRSPT